jgi:hypothetical protein
VWPPPPPPLLEEEEADEKSPNRRIVLPVDTSHKSTARSPPADAKVALLRATASERTSYACELYVWIRRPAGGGAAAAAAAAAAWGCLWLVVVVIKDDVLVVLVVVVVEEGLYSRMDRSAEPVRMYVPGEAE